MSKTKSEYKSAVNKIFGTRVKELRTERNMTQTQMSQEFAIFAASSPIQPMTISSWEQGKKLCTVETLKYLALFFGVSADYLLGISDEENEGKIRDASTLDLISPDEQVIKYNDLASVDGLPVVIESDTGTFGPLWAIYDHNKHRFLTKNGQLTYRPDIKVRSSIPFSMVTMEIFKKSMLTATQLQMQERFWVIKVDGTEKEKRMYTGWYRHNEDKTCIINDRGLTLPYSGLGISYNAFSDEPVFI